MTHRPNPDAPLPWPKGMGRHAHDQQPPTSRGALWMAHTMTRWVLAHVAQHGQVTALTVSREFPAAVPGRVRVLLRNMAAHGVLTCLNPDAPRNVPPVYGRGDLSDLHALHAELTGLLALTPTPEVPHETHD